MALFGLKGEKTLTELAHFFEVHANQIAAWKAQLLEGAAVVFDSAAPGVEAAPVDLKALHAKIGELENDFLEGALTKVGMLSAKR